MPVVAVANRLPVQRGEDGWELSRGVWSRRCGRLWPPTGRVGRLGRRDRGMPPVLPGSVSSLPIGLSAAQVAATTPVSPTRRCGRCCTTRSRSPGFERAWWRAYPDVNAILRRGPMTAL